MIRLLTMTMVLNVGADGVNTNRWIGQIRESAHVRTRLVRIRDISQQDEDAWRRLAGLALEPNLFAEPDFLMLYARRFEGYADAKLLIAEDDSEFRAVLPICRIIKSRMPPGKVARIRSVPGVGGVSRLAPGRLPSSPDQASGALVDALRRAAKSGDLPGFVLFDQIGGDGPVIESLRRACQERRCPIFVKDTWERGTVTRAGRWASPVDGRRRREFHERSACSKRHRREVVLVDRTSDPSAWTTSWRWKCRDGRAVRGVGLWRSSHMAEWFREFTDRWIASSRLTVLSLNLGSAPIAMHYFARAGDGLFCFRMAFDEEYGKFGPGGMLLNSAMHYLRDNTDAAWIDSWTDRDNAFMLGMLPERRALSTLLIGIGGTLDRTLVSALPTITKTVAAGKQLRDGFVRDGSA